MPLNSDLHQALQQSNDRIAIVGRWTSKPKGVGVYRFSKKKDPKPDGTIRVVDLFEVVRPHLEKKPDVVVMGNRTYNVFVLGEPGSGGDRLELLADSNLLDGAADVLTEAQEEGGRLVERLVGALDRLIPFAGSKFSSKLLEVAARYLHQAALRLPGSHLPNPGKLADLALVDHGLGALLVRFLTAYETDETEIRGLVRQRLRELAKGEAGRGVFTSEHQAEQITGMLEALVRCKATLLDGAESDAIWQAEFSVGDNRVELGLETDELFDLYRRFRIAADEVHRLVRSEPLHASMVLWLFSKYRVGGAFQGKPATDQAAREAFRLGVEDWGDQRVRALTQEQVDVFTARAEEVAVDLEGIPADDEFFPDYLDEIGLHTIRMLQASKRYTKAELEKRAGRLFVRLAESAGAVGRMVDEVKERIDELRPLWVALLNLDDDAIPEAMRAKLDEKRAEVGERAPELFSTDRVEGATKDEFLASFVAELSRSGKQDLAQRYRADLAEIQQKRKHFWALYRVFRGGAAAESTKTSAGTAGVGLANVTLEAEEQQVSARASKQEVFQQAQAGFTAARKHGPVPAAPPAGGTPRPESTDDPAPPAPPSDDAAPATEAESTDDPEAAGGSATAVANVTLDPELSGARETDPSQVLDELPSFAETQDAILTHVNSPEGEANRGRLQALILSEFILASPGEATSLDSDDLSNLLGLLVDIMEHTGDARGEARYYRPGHDEGDTLLTSCLKRINLSRYFPANGFQDLRSVMSWLQRLNNSLAKVSPYLVEVRRLRDTFALLAKYGDPDLEVVVVDDTLKGLASQTRPGETPWMQARPGLLYLTSLAGGGLDQLAKRLRQTVDRKKTVHVPLVFAADGAAGSSRLPTLDDGDFAPIITGGKFGLVVQGLEVDLPPILLLALAPRLADDSLGRIVVDLDDDFGEFPIADEDEPLCSYLKRLWLDPKILGPYLSSRWAAVASSLVSDQLTWDKLKTTFGKQVNEQLKSAADRQAAYQCLPLAPAQLGGVEILADTYQENQLGNGSIERNLGAKVLTTARFGVVEWLKQF